MCSFSLLSHLWVKQTNTYNILVPAKTEVLTMTMSNPPIPPEILDHIVDDSYDESDALRNCCLVAKSWVPRTRKHLFADIEFYLPKRLESWKMMFPDPSNSPAYHAHTLLVRFPQVVTAADAGEGGWVRTFSRSGSCVQFTQRSCMIRCGRIKRRRRLSVCCVCCRR